MLQAFEIRGRQFNTVCIFSQERHHAVACHSDAYFLIVVQKFIYARGRGSSGPHCFSDALANQLRCHAVCPAFKMIYGYGSAIPVCIFQGGLCP